MNEEKISRVISQETYLRNIFEKKDASTKILLLASVLWSDFSDILLARILKRPQRSIKIYLNRFVKNKVMTYLPDRNTFIFKSIEIKNWVYFRISVNDRKLLHKQVMQYLHDQEISNNYSFDIAYHGLQADVKEMEMFAIKTIKTEICRYQDEKAAILLELIEKKQYGLFFYILKSEYCKARGDIKETIQYLKKAMRLSIRNKDFESVAYLLIGYFFNLSFINSEFSLYSVIFNKRFYSQFIRKNRRLKVKLLSVLAEKAYDRGAWGIANNYIRLIRKRDAAFYRIDERGELHSVLSKIKMNQGDYESGTRYLLNSLLKKRKIADREITSSALVELAWFHELNGDSNRAFNILNWVLKTSTTIQRPRIYLTALWIKTIIYFDQGTEDFEDLINDISRLKCSDLARSQICLLCYINAKQAARKGEWTIVCQNINIFFHELPSHLFEISRMMLLLIMTLPQEHIKKYVEVLETISIKVNKYWNKYFFDPLPFILMELCYYKLNPEKVSGNRLKSIEKMIEMWQDPVAETQYLIYKLQCVTEIDRCDHLVIDDFKQKLNHPLFRELLIDLFYVYGNYVIRADHKMEGLKYLIRSRDLAYRIKDRVRREKAELVLGSIVGFESVSNLSHFAKISDDLLWNLLSISKSENLEILTNSLQKMCYVLFASRSGVLFEFMTENEVKKWVWWGKGLSLPEQRLVNRTIRKLWRNMELITHRDKLVFLMLVTTTHFKGSLVLKKNKNSRLFFNNDVLLQLFVNILSLKLKEFKYIKTPLSQNEKTTTKKENENIHLKAILGDSDSIRNLKKTIVKISDSPTNVYIYGETGVGKEMVAKAIHYCGRRRNMPFIAYNCSSSNENLVESDLFGHVKGAFSGAKESRKGLFVAATGGTLFLDEVADLPPKTQVKILRAIQEKCIRPVGADYEISIDVRLISASNKDLFRHVQNRHFREDLFFRLVVLQLDIPPLRDRKEDIPILVHHFIQKYSHILGYPNPGITREAMDLLIGYDWPGNVRELQNLIEAVINLAPQGLPIDRDDVYFRLRKKSAEIIHLAVYLEETERLYISKVLTYYKGNMSKAAEALNISRQGLFKKIRRLGIMSRDEKRECGGVGGSQ